MTPEEQLYLEDLESQNEKLTSRCEKLEKEVDELRPLVRMLQTPKEDFWGKDKSKDIEKKIKYDEQICILEKAFKYIQRTIRNGK